MKKTIYLYRSGKLKREDNSLVLVDKELNRTYIPIEQIDLILVFSEIDFNKRVLALCNKNKISILFFNYYGQYIGRYSPRIFYDGKLLIQQIDIYNNKEKKLYIAKQIIKSSLINTVNLLKYYNKKLMLFDKQIKQIENNIKEIVDKKTVNSIMLLEAQSKQIYYSCFDKITKDSLYVFNHRTLHPPQNRINALMSYGYSLLYGTLLGIIDRSNMYSQISFVHSLTKTSDSLQYDLADIYKPVIIDRIIFRIIRKNQINENYFIFKNDGCYLNKEGIKIIVEEYDKVMNKTIFTGKRNYTYKNLLVREVYNLANYIKGDNKSYKGFIMKW